jgi:hypothetical protein
MYDTMRYRIVGILAVVVFAIMMAVRSELSSVAARAVMAAIAFTVGGFGLSYVLRSAAERRRREQS